MLRAKQPHWVSLPCCLFISSQLSGIEYIRVRFSWINSLSKYSRIMQFSQCFQECGTLLRMSLNTITDLTTPQQILRQGEMPAPTHHQVIFPETEGKRTPRRQRQESRAASLLCALWKLTHTVCVWSYLWHQYNMMQTWRSGNQVMLKALQRFLTLCTHSPHSTKSPLFRCKFPVFVVLHYCRAFFLPSSACNCFGQRDHLMSC